MCQFYPAAKKRKMKKGKILKRKKRKNIESNK